MATVDIGLTEKEIHHMMNQITIHPDANEKRLLRKYLELVRYIPHWTSCFSGQEVDFFTQIKERFYCHKKGYEDDACNEAEQLLKVEDAERLSHLVNSLQYEGLVSLTDAQIDEIIDNTTRTSGLVKHKVLQKFIPLIRHSRSPLSFYEQVQAHIINYVQEGVVEKKYLEAIRRIEAEEAEIERVRLEEYVETYTDWNPLGLEGRKRKNKSKKSKKSKKSHSRRRK